MRPAYARWAACASVTVLLWAAALCPAKAAETGKSQGTAGWAEVEITPPLGIALGGRGGAETLAKKVLDPLYAQVLYLKDAKGRGFVLASFDVIGLPHDLSDRLRQDIVQELGVDWNLVVLNASHTHSGPHMLRSLMAGVGPAPPIEADYFKTLEEKVIAATRAAARAMQPVRVEAFQGGSQFGINRRGKGPRGQDGMFPNPQGPFDEKVWVMRLSPENGDPPAVVFSYACHAVFAYGYAYDAISADFPGATRAALRDSLGPKAHVQFIQGFAGNIRPRILADLENHRFRQSTPEDLQQAGKDMADAVLAAMNTSGKTLSLSIVGAADRPFLPRDNPPPRAQYEKMRDHALADHEQVSAGIERVLAETLRLRRRLCEG